MNIEVIHYQPHFDGLGRRCLPFRLDVMHCQEGFEFVRAEIGENFPVHHQRGRKPLAGKADHLVVIFGIGFHIDLLIAVTMFVEPSLGADAPRAPRFDVKFKRSGHGINCTRCFGGRKGPGRALEGPIARGGGSDIRVACGDETPIPGLPALAPPGELEGIF